MVSEDCKRYGAYGICGFLCLWALIILITVFACIRQLGPRDQILEYGPTGKRVINGPQDTVVHPFRKREMREAIRIGAREYLVVKNQQSGLIRHEEGDGQNLYFLGAWDESMGIKPKITLVQNEYKRLVDELTGEERVVRGPMMFTPRPLEIQVPANGETFGIIITAGKSVLTLNKTEGIRKIYHEPGIFIPGPYEEILQERDAIVVGEKRYARVKNLATGEITHESADNEMLKLGAYEELIEIRDRIPLQMKEYCRLVDMATGEEAVYRGPALLKPKPFEVSKDAQTIQRGIDIAADTAVLLMDKKTGREKLVKTVGLFIPEAYEEVVEVRTSTLLTEGEYAVLRNTTTGDIRHEAGPGRFLLETYEEFIAKKPNIILEFGEYIRLTNRFNGSEVVEHGPKNFVPDPMYLYDQVESGKFIDMNTAVLVQSNETGLVSLKTEFGAYIPSNVENVLETQEKTDLTAWQTMIIRNDTSHLSVKRQSAFFMEPYTVPVDMYWSVFDEAHRDGKNVQKEKIEKVDMRLKSMFFTYEARTKDNVVLHLNGTIFWQPVDSDGVEDHPTVKMIKNTADVVEDIWYHCKSKMIQAVGSQDIEEFNNNMQGVAMTAESAVKADTAFYERRGVEVKSLELTGKEPVERTTAEILEQITTMQTDLTNTLEKQKTAQTVQLQEVIDNITLEGEKTVVILAENNNTIQLARNQGKTEGLVEVEAVKTYLTKLNVTIKNEDERINLYEMSEKRKGKDVDVQNMKDGDLKLFMTPDNAKMRMDMSGLKDQWDDNTRRLATTNDDHLIDSFPLFGTQVGRKIIENQISRMKRAGPGNDWRSFEL